MHVVKHRNYAFLFAPLFELPGKEEREESMCEEKGCGAGKVGDERGSDCCEREWTLRWRSGVDERVQGREKVICFCP